MLAGNRATQDQTAVARPGRGSVSAQPDEQPLAGFSTCGAWLPTPTYTYTQGSRVISCMSGIYITLHNRSQMTAVK